MKESIESKNNKRYRRRVRTKAGLVGTPERPRLVVFRSLKHLSVQAIDDLSGKTLASATDKEVKTEKKQDTAAEIGKLIAKKLLNVKIDKVVFDKRHYKYHGLVKQVAESAREAGLNF